ncbi:MAG TPA: hypothetical protein VGM53_32360 [Streptosporangiaceae bacterium]
MAGEPAEGHLHLQRHVSSYRPRPGTCNVGSWGYPQTCSADGSGENYWVDIEVTPA